MRAVHGLAAGRRTMANCEYLMPKLGHLQEAGSVVQWMKQPGETVRKGEILCVIETGKTQVEVESPFDGRLLKFLVDPGIEVPVNAPIAEYEEARKEG
jgi:pyruvate dehydrogenase E2 component (dihydrolipoamide acetyltransferase)